MIAKDFKFKKYYGQNFLKDEGILDKIISLSDIGDNSLVIEIGCGSGQLTKKLINNFNNVIGYEIDIDLKPYLDELGRDNLEIIYDDFLKRNIKEDIKKYEYDKLYIVSNLPYYITTPIIEKIILDNLDVYRVIIMVQKEVGDRINAKPNSKEYNSLSIFINYNYDVKKILNVNRHAFIPSPNVDSIVLKLSKKIEALNANNEEHFYRLIRDSFRYKRKTLKNNLFDYDFEIISQYLKNNDLPLNIRGEQLTIKNFIDISNTLVLNKK